MYVVYSFLSYVTKKLETWLVSPGSRSKYFGTKPIAFLSIIDKKYP